jgi:hypothetical protein
MHSIEFAIYVIYCISTLKFLSLQNYRLLIFCQYFQGIIELYNGNKILYIYRIFHNI